MFALFAHAVHSETKHRGSFQHEVRVQLVNGPVFRRTWEVSFKSRLVLLDERGEDDEWYETVIRYVQSNRVHGRDTGEFIRDIEQFKLLRYCRFRSVFVSNAEPAENSRHSCSAFKIMMKKHLTKLQWRMMILLTVGCMISQLGAKEGGSGEHVRFADDRHIFAGAGMTRRRGASPYSSMSSLASSSVSSVLDNEEERTKRRMLLASSFSDYGRLTQGYVLESFAIVASSIAGVCVEMFLKNTPNPFYFQNALLYGWGTMITFASLVWETNAFENGVHYELFRGHTLVSLALVANSAFGGIATSAVMKYLDVIAKTFATTVSLFIVAFVSIAYFGETVRAELFLGVVVAAIAIEGYYHGPALIDEDPNTILEKKERKKKGARELNSDFTLGGFGNDDDDEVTDPGASEDAAKNEMNVEEHSIINSSAKDAVV